MLKKKTIFEQSKFIWLILMLLQKSVNSYNVFAFKHFCQEHSELTSKQMTTKLYVTCIIPALNMMPHVLWYVDRRTSGQKTGWTPTKFIQENLTSRTRAPDSLQNHLPHQLTA